MTEPHRQTDEEFARRQKKKEAKERKKEQFQNISLEEIWKYSRNKYPDWKKLNWDQFIEKWDALTPIEQQNAFHTIHLLMFLDRESRQFRANKLKYYQQIDIDSHAKSAPEFREYTLAMAHALDQLVQDGVIVDWHYIAQNRKTQLDTSLDSSGVDWIIQVPDFLWKTYILLQQATSFENMEEKIRELTQRYPKMAQRKLIGVVAVRKGYVKDGTGAADMNTLLQRIRQEIEVTEKFRIGSIFSPKF